MSNKPWIIIAPFLKVDGMALFPFILVRNKNLKCDKVLIRHEQIHLKQEAELLVIPFYIIYLFSYIYYRFKLRDHNKAYHAICFEREAYAFERDQNYLKRRRLWAWIHI